MIKVGNSVFVSVKEACAMYRMGEHRVRYLYQKGHIPVIRLGKKILLDASDIEQAINPTAKEQ